MSTGRHNNSILSQLNHAQAPWLLRSLIVMRQQNASTSGFVLPTVAMVSLVIVLLTTAILVRSFDRSRNASNLRVSEAALNAATPALDRARAKIDALLIDQTLPQLTPTDAELETALNRNTYSLGDETRLKLAQDNTSTNSDQNNTLTTAWKFPVDTDSNGKFDSYTFYSIYFRSGIAEEARTLQVRTPPMQGEVLGRECENIVRSSNRPLESGWYQTGSKLSKSFFVYTATVPITNPPIDNNYEVYRGNRSFYALEFQQDRSRIPLKNHAALFQNDLEVTPNSNFRLNGRIATNGNLLVGGTNNQTSRFYQVSSQYSCFYDEENGKITVGGNVGLGNVADTSDRTAATVDLFDGFGNPPTTVSLDRNIKSTTTQGGAQVGYNDAAYNHRIALMKQTALYFHPNFNRRNTIDEIPPTVESVAAVRQYPQEVKEGFRTAIADTPTQRGSSLDAWDVLGEQIETYLENLTRRVPYAEIATSDRRIALNRYDFDGDGIDTSVFASNAIEPPLEWREPTPTNTRLTLNQYNLPQTQPENQQQAGKETYIGDRISVGNNLPTFWKKAGNLFLGFNEKQLFDNNITWTNPNTQPRYRTTQTLPIPDRKIVERNGFWENAAAQQFSTTLNGAGGLRIITGAGIYSRDTSQTFLSEPEIEEGVTEPEPFTTRSVTNNNANVVVWSDALPMTGDAEDQGKGDLQMRATVVYHYKDSAYTDTDYIERTPTACVSSYYNPTNAITARNQNSLPDVSGVIDGAQPAGGRSNNGVVYPSPYNGLASREAAVNQYREQLNFQARLIFPNGRVVNQPLRDALVKIDDNRTRSLADNSAIDAAICAIRIADGDLSPTGNPIIPHGAIKEASFLDAREIQAVDNEQSNYDLELEKRQPIEVRVTDIDLGLLAETGIGADTNPQEYVLPNSGIVYASRDDALADSSTSTNSQLLSPTDFILDATRRPSGIRLINGSNLARENDYRAAEKGLTFVTNLPAYILGDFNLHQQPLTQTPTEEFLERLTPNWINFYSRNSTFDNNFACVKGQRGCGNNGDQWRPATIVSDAVTVLSNNFVDGFRSDGDYDLNNYAGTSVTTQRKKNGFFDNSFVTSAAWLTDNVRKNSYLNNGVTPVQRRANFSEYVMEICRKIPVSECQPNDWVVGYDSDRNGNITDEELEISAADIPAGTLVDSLVAGTTATPAKREEDRRYARRIAFKRSGYGTLELTDNTVSGEVTPIPFGINAEGQVAEYPYTTINVPRVANNALWFRTTTNRNQPYNNPSYENNQPLAYTQNTQLISPSTPDISGVPSLNSPEGNPISAYTICTNNAGYAKQYEFDNNDRLNNLPGGCNLDVYQQSNLYRELRNLNPDSDENDDIVEPAVNGSFAAGQETTITANDSKPVNVVNIERDIATNNQAATTIRLVGKEDAIFVLKNTTANLQFGGGNDHKGVKLDLVGVNPNNVFWVVNGSLIFNKVADEQENLHSLAGTFLGNGGTPRLQSVEINGRLIGFDNLPAKGDLFPDNSKITAITSEEQPLLIPVLQIHSPNGSPGGSTLDRGSADLQQWLQTPENDTTVNAVFVSGNSPSRPQEEPAGLHNFVRLLENWQDQTLNIKGSFIQLYRSVYATAPFAPILAGKSTANDGSLSIFGYDFTQYRTSNGQFAGTLPYFSAPNRQWSFDVGLLSQSPDLFAQKFTQPVQTANEFVREVNREDAWIETLLCAAQGSGNNYNYAVEESDRPRNCPPLTAYQDQTSNNNITP